MTVSTKSPARSAPAPPNSRRANGLKPASIIHPGQKLKVPGTNTVASAPAAAASAAATAPAAQQQRKNPHGPPRRNLFQHLQEIRNRAPPALIAANPTVKASALRPGQVVRLGSSSSTTTDLRSGLPSQGHASRREGPGHQVTRNQALRAGEPVRLRSPTRRPPNQHQRHSSGTRRGEHSQPPPPRRKNSALSPSRVK